jgi:hypothetical protein
MTTAATASFLQSEILGDLQKQYPEHAASMRVEIESEGDDGQWRAHAYSSNGVQLPLDYKRTVIFAQQRLRREYHLASVD